MRILFINVFLVLFVLNVKTLDNFKGMEKKISLLKNIKE